MPERIETVRLWLLEPPNERCRHMRLAGSLAGAIILDNDCLLFSPEQLVDCCLHLRLPVPTGMPFRLEASTNLLDWEEVACNANAEDGVSVVDDEKAEHGQRFFQVVPEFGETRTLVDANAANASQRFYRVRRW